MTRIILNGCCGNMGAAITRVVSQLEDNIKIVAGVDTNDYPTLPYPVFATFSELNIKGDLIIDFSNPASLSSVLEYAISEKTPVVIATTGFDKSQIKEIKIASAKVPIFNSANMSLGISLLVELAKISTRALGEGFDIEIVESHHNQKLDAPSGTAFLIADAIKNISDDEKHYEYNRHIKREKRNPQEIGIHSVRAGTIVGEHQVIFGGHDEVITLSHSALSKDIFAQGAINAGLFLLKQKNGLYSMEDLVNQ
ncbi:MAG TPA: 4-hydroxy-tetrahydrodipicolinate reductase [Oscillospiraceae bacterium]|nr:4-hydroxy-tetrahydrodipicolinate reductase [Oscillospiraceae bacterium]